MTEPERVQGLIIRSADSGEANLVLTLITKERGKIAAFAKSARRSQKRFSGGLEIFDRGEFEFGVLRDTKLLVLQAFKPEPMFQRIRQDLTKLSVSSLLCEACDALLLEGIEEEENFVLMETALRSIDEAANDRESLRSGYFGLANLLIRTGFADVGAIKEPSAKSMLGLLERLESCVEREIKSKNSVRLAIESLTQKK